MFFKSLGVFKTGMAVTGYPEGDPVTSLPGFLRVFNAYKGEKRGSL